MDSLINQLLSLKALSPLPQSKLSGQVLEAVVMSATPLLTGKHKSEGQYRLLLKGPNNQQYELTSQQALASGSRLQLKLNHEQQAVLLKVLDQGPSASGHSKPAAGTNPGSGAPAGSEPGAAPAPTNADRIAEGVRQKLPLQQPLKALLPLLQLLGQQRSDQLPSPLATQLSTLLKQFNTPQQLQQAAAVKQAIRNSGIFLESKLAFSQQSNNTAALLKSPALQHDIKALLNKLSQELGRSNPVAPGDKLSQPSPAARPLATAINQPGIATPPADDGEQAVVQAGPAAPASTANANTSSAARSEMNTGLLLQQLGRQLLAGLSRTQLNQLESLTHRASNSPDQQAPVNSWVLELPIINGQRVDNLELRISQQQGREQAQGKKQQQWTVLLSFDLHSLGKMNVELKVVEHSVAATIWSQLQHTHEQVQGDIASLRHGLEQAGIAVEQVNCFHGLPSSERPQLNRQLVDLHT